MTIRAFQPAAGSLSIRGVSVHFGGVQAIDDLNLDVESGSVCGLIGPNGAGKTTLFNSITRTVRPSQGSITFAGISLLSRRASDLAEIGIRRTFQNLALFPGMDVRTNVLVGAHVLGRTGWFRALSRIGVAKEEARLRSAADHALDLLDLSDFAEAKVTDLPFGTLKRVELARAVVSRPRLLLLDEPANGLRASEASELADLLLRIREELALTMVIVEHNVRLVMRISDTIAAMAAGRMIAHGAPRDVRNHPEVVRVFLGGSV